MPDEKNVPNEFRILRRRHYYYVVCNECNYIVGRRSQRPHKYGYVKGTTDFLLDYCLGCGREVCLEGLALPGEGRKKRGKSERGTESREPRERLESAPFSVDHELRDRLKAFISSVKKKGLKKLITHDEIESEQSRDDALPSKPPVRYRRRYWGEYDSFDRTWDMDFIRCDAFLEILPSDNERPGPRGSGGSANEL